MRLMFITGQLMMGGVETLITRMARQLASEGHDVFVVLLTWAADPQLLADLQQSAQVLYAEKNIYLSPPFGLLKAPPGGIDAIHCFNSMSLLAGAIIRQDYYPKTPLVAGVYFPREYFVPYGRRRYLQRLVERLFGTLPATNVFFMNEECALAQRPFTAFSPEEEVIVPLPVDTSKYAETERTPVRHRLVSVGRLTPFKTYPFHVVSAMPALIQLGYDVEYHVYGDGEERERLERHIQASGLSSRVHLHGTLPYERFADVMRDAGAFIGMGTSLIEASACGVPSLIAIESNPRPTSYGWFSGSPGFHCGERTDRLRESELVDDLAALFELAPDGYASYEAQAKLKAKAFSLDTNTALYLTRLRKAQSLDLPVSNAAKLGSFFERWIWRLLKALGCQDAYTQRYSLPGGP